MEDGRDLDSIYLTSVIFGFPTLYVAQADSSMYFPAALFLSPVVMKVGYEVFRVISGRLGGKNIESKVSVD
jgi:hypothetical protein